MGSWLGGAIKPLYWGLVLGIVIVSKFVSVVLFEIEGVISMVGVWVLFCARVRGVKFRIRLVSVIMIVRFRRVLRSVICISPNIV